MIIVPDFTTGRRARREQDLRGKRQRLSLWRRSVGHDVVFRKQRREHGGKFGAEVVEERDGGGGGDCARHGGGAPRRGLAVWV